jgi:hypothetical protein
MKNFQTATQSNSSPLVTPKIGDRSFGLCSTSQRKLFQPSYQSHAMPSDKVSIALLYRWRTAMKTIVSTLVALSVLAGIAGQAAALDTRTFFEQQDRSRY